MMYNVPSRTGVDMAPETVLRLAAVPNVAALKEAAWTPERLREVLSRSPAGFAIYSGDDATCWDFWRRAPKASFRSRPTSLRD